MERLTEVTDEGIWAKESHGDNALKTLYQCYGAEPLHDYSNCVEGYCGMEKLAEYENAEDDGLLIRLPCKMGEILYLPHRDRVESFRVNRMVIYGDRIEIGAQYYGEDELNKYWHITFLATDIGCMFFRTKEDAWQKLRIMESRN